LTPRAANGQKRPITHALYFYQNKDDGIQSDTRRGALSGAFQEVSTRSGSVTTGVFVPQGLHSGIGTLDGAVRPRRIICSPAAS
jgi:hypothetical protein